MNPTINAGIIAVHWHTTWSQDPMYRATTYLFFLLASLLCLEVAGWFRSYYDQDSLRLWTFPAPESANPMDALPDGTLKAFFSRGSVFLERSTDWVDKPPFWQSRPVDADSPTLQSEGDDYGGYPSGYRYRALGFAYLYDYVGHPPQDYMVLVIPLWAPALR